MVVSELPIRPAKDSGLYSLLKKPRTFAQPWKSGHLWPRKRLKSVRALAPVVVSDLPIESFSNLFRSPLYKWFWEGHGFSRAAQSRQNTGLAPEVRFS